MTKKAYKRTQRHVHLTQCDGLQIERVIYTDGIDEFIKINGFLFNLWEDIDDGKIWNVDYVY